MWQIYWRRFWHLWSIIGRGVMFSSGGFRGWWKRITFSKSGNSGKCWCYSSAFYLNSISISSKARMSNNPPCLLCECLIHVWKSGNIAWICGRSLRRSMVNLIFLQCLEVAKIFTENSWFYSFNDLDIGWSKSINHPIHVYLSKAVLFICNVRKKAI